MKTYPKIESVKSLTDFRLLITFKNQAKKIYKCDHLFSQEVFQPLKEKSLFNSVKVDPGGYGISWNDEIDLAESELWINGEIAEQ